MLFNIPVYISQYLRGNYMFFVNDARKQELYFMIKTHRPVYTLQSRDMIEKGSEEFFTDHYTLPELIEYGVFTLHKFNEKSAKVMCNETIKLVSAQTSTVSEFNKNETLTIQLPTVVVEDLKCNYNDKYVG